MHKIPLEALIARFVHHSGCGPNSIYKRIKLCDKQIWSFSAWPFSSVLYTQRETCFGKGDC